MDALEQAKNMIELSDSIKSKGGIQVVTKVSNGAKFYVWDTLKSGESCNFNSTFKKDLAPHLKPNGTMLDFIVENIDTWPSGSLKSVFVSTKDIEQECCVRITGLEFSVYDSPPAQSLPLGFVRRDVFNHIKELLCQ